MPSSLKTVVCRACQIKKQDEYAWEILARRGAEGYAVRAKRAAAWAAQSEEWAAFVAGRMGRGTEIAAAAPIVLAAA